MKIVFDFAPHVTHKMYDQIAASLTQYRQDDYDYWLTCDNLVAMENLMEEFEVGLNDELVCILETWDWTQDNVARAISQAYSSRVKFIYFSGWGGF